MKRFFWMFVGAWCAIFIVHFFFVVEYEHRKEARDLRAVVDSVLTKLDSTQNTLAIAQNDLELIKNPPLPKELYWCGEHVPLENGRVRRKLYDEIYKLVKYQDNRLRISMYLQQAKFYFPYWDAWLTRDGLPLDLKFIAVIESEFDNEAKSPANADGQWQLIPWTAIYLGLEFRYYVDERRDFVRSYEGAREYLRENYAMFGRWDLSAAAYNTSREIVLDAIREQISAKGSYYHIILPKETRNYNYLFLAAKVVMENYGAYGFQEPIWDVDEIIFVDYVVPGRAGDPPVDLYVIAAMFNMSPLDFYDLNPQFYRFKIPPGRYVFKILKSAQNGIVQEENTMSEYRSSPFGPIIGN